MGQAFEPVSSPEGLHVGQAFEPVSSLEGLHVGQAFVSVSSLEGLLHEPVSSLERLLYEPVSSLERLLVGQAFEPVKRLLYVCLLLQCLFTRLVAGCARFARG